jgi:hypothetical protein
LDLIGSMPSNRHRSAGDAGQAAMSSTGVIGPLGRIGAT